MDSVLFTLFGAVLMLGYVLIRRGLTPLIPTAAAVMFAGVVTMVLFLWARSDDLLRAVVTGIPLGMLFVGAMLAVAWYFQNNDHHTRAENLRAIGEASQEQDPRKAQFPPEPGA